MTAIAAEPKLVTADELLAMSGVGRCELIYGELVMMSPAGLEHGVVAMRFGSHLLIHVEANDLGVCPAAETGYKIESNPDLVRAPDASFIAEIWQGHKDEGSGFWTALERLEEWF